MQNWTCLLYVHEYILLCVEAVYTSNIWGMSSSGIKEKVGLVRDSNPGPLAPEARIIPLDQRAISS